jgi:ABC-type transporter Mla subunit MlaD
MTNTNRDGVFMRSGSIERSTIAVGSHATAVTIIDHASAALDDHGQHEIAARLRELLQALNTEKDQLGDSSQSVHDQTAAAAEELEQPEPRKSVVIRLLRGVAEDSRAVASVVNAVHSLIDAVQRLL